MSGCVSVCFWSSAGAIKLELTSVCPDLKGFNYVSSLLCPIYEMGTFIVDSAGGDGEAGDEEI